MKNYSTKLVPVAVALLSLLPISATLGQSPTPAARKQLDNVIDYTGKFDGAARGKGGSTIDTTVRPSTTTAPSTAVRPSTTTVPSTVLTKPTETTTKPAPQRPSIDHIYVPSPVVKTQPAPKPQPKPEPKKDQPSSTGTVPTGK